ncbi:MAG: nucleotidyltransferase family protein [Oscillospiraceae bacterium]|nr:nucleotidyltransferase family protein [Oscillospiraceae bacterium]
MTTEAVLFALLRYEISGEPVSEEVKASLCGDVLDQIYTVAKQHDLAHLAGDALSKLGVLKDDEISQKLKQAAFQAVYRYAQLNYAYQSVCKLLEEAKIPFIPLKGSVLRSYYPEPWMRTSCDIDVLVHEEDVQPAIDALTQQLQYQFKGQWFYEYSLYSPDGVHLELHSNTIEKEENAQCEAVLRQVWERSYPEAGSVYKRALTDEMFWFYHIQHMTKHFAQGGCGIRPFLDVWVMNHRMEFDRQKRQMLVAEGGLDKFSAAAEALAEVWFAGAQPSGLTQQMEQYVITGGVYGNVANRAAVETAQKGSRFKRIWTRIFMPYEIMQYLYPTLQKRKWLFPFYQILRWLRMLFGGGAGRALRELKMSTELSAEQNDAAGQMLIQLGLRSK